MKRIITQTDKDAFLEFYFGWRAEGKNIRECYRLARQAYIAEGRDSVPSFSTLRRWLYPNASKKVKMTAGAESEEAGREDVKAIAACGNEDAENEAEGGLEEEQNNNEVYAKSIAAAAKEGSKKVKKTAGAESEEAGRKNMTAGAESEEAGRKNMTADAESERAAWTPEVLTPDDRRKITEQMGYDFDIGSALTQ